MYIALILNLSLINRYYGRIPETSDAPANSYELHYFTFNPFDYFDLIDTDFVNPVNELCGALLDIGDVDYLDAQQCSILVPWLVKRLTQACPHPLDEFYTKLLDFAQRAVELGTGVVVEL